MLSRIGRFSSLARRSASSPHGYQSTGLWACWSRYGLVSWIKRLVCRGTVCWSISTYPLFATWPHGTRGIFEWFEQLSYKLPTGRGIIFTSPRSRTRSCPLSSHRTPPHSLGVGVHFVGGGTGSAARAS